VAVLSFRRAGTPLLAAAGASLLASCASGGSASGGSESRSGAAVAAGSTGALREIVGPGGLVRRVYGPEVVDEDGSLLEHPWFGGLNQPRPQLADTDGDGDLDLFVQERSGRIAWFENVGAAGSPRFRWRTDRFHGLDVGEWYRFADLDGDGDPDLLGEARFSLVRLWRNESGPGGTEFHVWADTLRDAAGAPLFSDRQNIPNATDVDCDGLVDLFVGRLTGTVSRYEEAGRDGAGAPRFALVTDRFENIEIVGQIGSLHGANTLAMGDVDGDGDVDMLWGDFFEPGLLLIENTGSCASPSLQGEPIPFPPGEPLRTSGYNAPALGDLDADGEPEMLVGVLGGAYDPSRTTVRNLWLLDRVDGSWRAVTSRALTMLDVGSESVPAFGDWDGDGDADLLVANKISDGGGETSRVFAFQNVGGPGRPRFRALGPLPIEGSYHYAPALGDLDGDGDADLLLGTWRDGILAFRNDGPDPVHGARWTALPEATIPLSRGSNATPTLGDVDGDGDLDLVAGEASGELNFWRNEGGSGWARFVPVTDRLGEIDAGRRSAPLLVDWDGDGRLALLVGSESDGIDLWRLAPTGGAAANGAAAGRADAPAAEPALVRVGSLGADVPAFAAPAAVDFDGDGDADLFVGGVGGGVMLFERVAP
jgi:hypothetical protein